MQYYILAEDFASALIGPFETLDAASSHIAFCMERGDAADMQIINSSEAAVERLDIGIEMTAEEDRNFVPSEMAKRYNKA